MANYTAADVNRLREMTGAGMLDSKNALVEADGDFERAVELLRIKGAKDVGKRAERATAEGLVAAKDGALIELNSETDFVAKNAEFQSVADQIVAAAAASKATDLDALKAAKVGDTTVEQVIADLRAKIVEGRVTGFYKDVVLLDQPSVSDNKKTVKALLDEAGVTVTRFVRFEVGQA